MPVFRKMKTRYAPESPQKNERILHEEFYVAMRFFASKLGDSGKQMALEVTNSVERIKQAWQLDEAIFQKESDQFDAYVQTIIQRLWKASKTDLSERLPLELVRRRLYMTLTTSLLSKMNIRSAFETEFGAIPELLKAMQDNHSVFCRFMAFCQARTPYFTLITAQTFWRTLETLRTEAS